MESTSQCLGKALLFGGVLVGSYGVVGCFVGVGFLGGFDGFGFVFL